MHNPLKQVVIDALQELKALDIKILDVSNISSFTDIMIIASGTSTRQIKSLADKVVEQCRKTGTKPLGVEGEREAEWILVDLGDVVVHIMSPQMRDFYNLEKLWLAGDANRDSSVTA